ncbi:MAG TPA: tetratricopeptide repeat protein [Deltaproteobacteria bacterium]|nr:tetratricopeptide repeat protein [Deltaproteobacteria bacterium]
MEKTYCSYHPTKPALWHCEGCDAAFCPDCITRRDLGSHRKNTLYLCPKCGSSASSLPVQNLIEPFWNRLPRFFVYPFTTTVVVFMLVLSLFITLFSSPSLVSGIIQLLLFGVLLKYCFAVLRQTARGNMNPPDIDEHTIADDFIVVAKYWLLGVVFIAAGLLSLAVCTRLSLEIGFAAGMGLFAACIVALLLLLPAEVIVLATSGRLLRALNPAVSVRMAVRMGSSYLLMNFFLIFLYLAPGTLAYLLRPFSPGFVTTFLLALANCYYSIVAHHLMGYVILQNHDTIGYDVDIEEQNACIVEGSSPDDVSRGVLNAANILIKEGKHSEAADLIRQETHGDITDLELAGRYHQLLKLTRQDRDMLEHAKRYLELLTKAGRIETARTVYLECVAADPSFNPRPQILFKIARSFSEAGNSRAALEAYNRFIQSSPDDPLVPKAYFLAANVFYEKMLSPEKAVKTLKRLMQKFPDNEIIPYAKKFLGRIEQHG